MSSLLSAAKTAKSAVSDAKSAVSDAKSAVSDAKSAVSDAKSATKDAASDAASAAASDAVIAEYFRLNGLGPSPLNTATANAEKQVMSQIDGITTNNPAAAGIIGKANQFYENIKNIDFEKYKTPLTEEDKFRAELLILSTKPEFQKYFSQRVVQILVSEFYKLLSELGDLSITYTQLLKTSKLTLHDEDDENYSEFFTEPPIDININQPCNNVVVVDKYNLVTNEKIKYFFKNAMILYSELVKEEFTKLGKVIKRYNKLKNKLKKQKDILEPKDLKEAEEQVKQIKQQFDISRMSGGFFQPKMQISDDNKELLENDNVIKFTPGGFSNRIKFYQVKKNNNLLTLIECNDDSIEITGTAADKILNSGNCEFVSNDNPDNNCKTLQKIIDTKIKNLDTFFYNILLRILINNKDEFLKCLRIKLSIILNKVLDKLYEILKSATREKLNSNIEHYTYSDKDNEIIKLTEKMFCITDFDLQPFRSIVELSLAKKHNQIEAVKAKIAADAQAKAKAKIAAWPKNIELKDYNHLKITCADGTTQELKIGNCIKINNVKAKIVNFSTKPCNFLKKDIVIGIMCEKLDNSEKFFISLTPFLNSTEKWKDINKIECKSKEDADTEDAKYEKITNEINYNDGINYYIKDENGTYKQQNGKILSVNRKLGKLIAKLNLNDKPSINCSNCYIKKNEKTEAENKQKEQEKLDEIYEKQGVILKEILDDDSKAKAKAKAEAEAEAKKAKAKAKKEVMKKRLQDGEEKQKRDNEIDIITGNLKFPGGKKTTRKSSSRVSRKTRRHKRTSR